MYILELTCSFERNILAANIRKNTKYTSLKSDIENAGYTCTLIPFEIGSRGHVTRGNRINITKGFNWKGAAEVRKTHARAREYARLHKSIVSM